MIANNRRVHIDLDVRGNGCSVMLHPKNMAAVRVLCSLSAFTRSAKIFIAANPAQIIVSLGQLLSLRRAFTDHQVMCSICVKLMLCPSGM